MAPPSSQDEALSRYSASGEVHVLVIKQRAKSLKEEDRHVWRRVCKETERPEWTVWEIILVVRKGRGS